MKKYIIIFLSIPSLLFAQNKDNEVVVIKSDNQIEEFTSSLGQNELRLDFLDLLVFPALSVGFEKINDSSSGYGATLFLNLGGEDTIAEVYNDKFALTPYYRFYFLQSEDYGGYGIFAEIFTKFSFGKYEKFNDFWDQNQNNETLSYSDIAPGLAVGRKWINRKGFTFELLFGVGRNLLYKSKDDDSISRTAGIVRAGISVGKRF
jgi:hypothetical protein